MNRILLVEDDPVTARLLTRALTYAGYQVEAVGDGYHAYQTGLHEHFDLVLLDQVLPGMLGAEILTAWQRAGVDTPVIMLSGLTVPDDVAKLLTAGAVDFIRKPFNLAELQARIRMVLQTRQHTGR